MLLEQGLLTRLKELLELQQLKENVYNSSEENAPLKVPIYENTQSNKSIYELVLLTICGIMRSPSILQRKLAMRAHSVGIESNFQSLYSPYMHFLRYCQLLFGSIITQQPPQESSTSNIGTKIELLSTLLCTFEVDVKFVHAAVAFGIINCLQLAECNDNYEVKVEAGYRMFFRVCFLHSF